MSSIARFVLDHFPKAILLTTPLLAHGCSYLYGNNGFMTFRQHCVLFYKTGRTCHAYLPSNGLLYQITSVVAYGLSGCFYWSRKYTAATMCNISLVVCGGLLLRHKRHPREQFYQYNRQERCAQFIFACSQLQTICKLALNGYLDYAHAKFSVFVRELYHVRFGPDSNFRHYYCFHDVLSLNSPSYIRDFYSLIQLCDTAFAVYPHKVFRCALKNYLLHDTVDIIADYLYDFKTSNVPKNSNKLFERCRIGFRDCEKTFVELMKSICE